MTGRGPAGRPAGTHAQTTAAPPLALPTAEDTHALGELLGGRIRAGDLVILAGALGAGKTVLAKGIAVGMGVTGIVMSPTFVIARVHRPARPGGVTLVHVDAYRLAGAPELDDLDLDTDLTAAAVVIEWGEGSAERLADDHLLVRLRRHPDDTRTAEVSGTGPRSRQLATEVTERWGRRVRTV